MQLLAVRRIPDSSSAVVASRGDKLAVGGDCDCRDVAAMAQKALHQGAAHGGPHPHGFVIAAGDQPACVGRKGKWANACLVAAKGQTLLAAERLPEPDLVVIGDSGEGAAVGCKHQAIEVAAIAAKLVWIHILQE